MNELQSENEKPLLIVKYVWWRVLYTQIWNLIFIGIGSIIFIGDCSYMKCLINILLLMVGAFGVYSFIEMLLFKQLSFYHDRIVKTYYLFGDRVFYLTNQTVLRRTGGTAFDFISFASNGKKSFTRIAISLHAIGLGQVYSQLLNTLSSISNRTVQEVESGFLNPFIKQTQQGE